MAHKPVKTFVMYLTNVLLALNLIVVSFFGGIFFERKYKATPITAPKADVISSTEIKKEPAPSINPEKLLEQVLPQKGFQSKIVLGDSIVKLVNDGVIDVKKFEDVFSEEGGLSEEQKKMLNEPTFVPLTINNENSRFMVDLLWPLGIANKNAILANSEAAKPENVNNLAATGGWTLGKKENGGEYYNKHAIIALTPEQENLVQKVSENIYRPCCNNSTAFPDCNHGAALLGLLQLGASQGLTEDELYKEAVKFNSFWFPEQYLKIAMAFDFFQKKSWNQINPKEILSRKYSSSSGFKQNVATPLAEIPGLLPKAGGGGGCGA